MSEVIKGEVYKAEVLVNSIMVSTINPRQDKKIYPRLEEIDDLIVLLKKGKRALQKMQQDKSNGR